MNESGNLIRVHNTLYYNGIKILEMSYVSFEKQNTVKPA